MAAAFACLFGSVPTVAAQPGALEGVWRSGTSTLRITVKGTEARAQFVEVGPEARNLGFKPGELSFVGSVVENYVHGIQTIRYGGACHPNGRKTPIIGRLTPNGQTLAIHHYAISVDNNCRDTGQYEIAQTLWRRAAGR